MKKLFHLFNKKPIAIVTLTFLLLSLGVAVTKAALTLSATTITSDGSIGVTAGGTNQNITLTPSGTGYTLLNGNVGIGTSTPRTALEIAGSITLASTTSSTTGVIYKGISPFIHDFSVSGTSGYNTFVGVSAGNFTMTGSTGLQGSYNTGNGYDVLNVNTTGSYNTGNGSFVFQNNTTGSWNTGSGYGALIGNTTGSYNIGSGPYALGSNTTGGNNTGIGYGALYSNSTGSSSVALGYSAGRYELGSNAFYVNNIDQVNTAGDKAYSLLYGTFSGTAGSTAGQQLVINGKVGIATTTPGSQLTVASGDVYISNVGSGVIFQPAAGTCFRLTLSAAGAISTSTVTCP